MLQYDWTKKIQDVWKLEEELDKDAVICGFDSTYTISALPRKFLKGLETSK
jgi:hypothetical protein